MLLPEIGVTGQRFKTSFPSLAAAKHVAFDVRASGQAQCTTTVHEWCMRV
jgi:hypothetical protein